MHLLLPLVLLGCQPAAPGYPGTKMNEYFPFDGEREAEYINDDIENVPWKLVIEKISPTELVDTAEVVEMEWTNFDTGDVLGSVRWSSDSSNSVQIHGYSDAAGEYITFDTPIQVTDDSNYMRKGDSVVTETNGFTFTSTLVGVESCPVIWTTDDWECEHILIDDGDGDDMAGPLFAGDYWLVTRYGPAWMKLTGDDQKWVLGHYDWDAAG